MGIIKTYRALKQTGTWVSASGPAWGLTTTDGKKIWETRATRGFRYTEEVREIPSAVSLFWARILLWLCGENRTTKEGRQVRIFSPGQVIEITW